MPDKFALLEKLDAALADTSRVFVGKGVDPETYYAQLRADIRGSLCEPFPASAKVVEPGFPHAEVGQSISGICLAHGSGYWLVYQPDEDRFYCFWGEEPESLGAYGVFGSPLYCWSA